MPDLEGPGLEAGIHREHKPLNPVPIFQKCGFYKHALLTGGADYGNDLWHLSILGTTWMDKGQDIAHAISKGHATYTPGETQEKYDQKVRARASIPALATPAVRPSQRRNAKHARPARWATRQVADEHPSGIYRDGKSGSGGNHPKPNQRLWIPTLSSSGRSFLLDILPPTLANFVDAEHRAMGADPSAIAMAALTVVAGAIHAETQVHIGDGWWEKPIIWTILVGQPSSMKSPTLEKATKPLSRIDHERDKRWRQERANWETSQR